MVDPAFNQYPSRTPHRASSCGHQYFHTTRRARHVYDWAAWDDTYDFAVNMNSDYLRANLGDATFSDNRLNLICYVGADGVVFWSRGFDLSAEETVVVRHFEAGDAIASGHPLSVSSDAGEDAADVGVRGVMLTSLGTMLIASRPILNSNNKGPIRGAMIMGRLLSGDAIATLREQTRVDFEIDTVTPGDLAAQPAEVVERLVDGQAIVVRQRDRSTLDVFAIVRDIGGFPILLLHAGVDREITARGTTAVRIAAASMLGMGVVVLLVLAFVVQRTVADPIAKLRARAVAITSGAGLPKPLYQERRDEIGALSRELQRMVDKLQTLSLNDDLTGLYNRRGFMTVAEQQLKLAHRNHGELELLYADLDNLKGINDKYGHASGDQALVDLASLLRDTFRDSDIIGRIGGDEFAVLLTAFDRTNAAGARLKDRLRIHNLSRKPHALSLSVGVSRYDPENHCGVEELMSRADRLMYREKRRHR